MHLLFSITSIEMYFMSGICAFVANLNKKYKKWKIVASGFYGESLKIPKG
jgi:VanZ family protein